MQDFAESFIRNSVVIKTKFITNIPPTNQCNQEIVHAWLR